MVGVDLVGFGVRARARARIRVTVGSACGGGTSRRTRQWTEPGAGGSTALLVHSTAAAHMLVGSGSMPSSTAMRSPSHSSWGGAGSRLAWGPVRVGVGVGGRVVGFGVRVWARARVSAAVGEAPQRGSNGGGSIGATLHPAPCPLRPAPCARRRRRRPRAAGSWPASPGCWGRATSGSSHRHLVGGAVRVTG